MVTPPISPCARNAIATFYLVDFRDDCRRLWSHAARLLSRRHDLRRPLCVRGYRRGLSGRLAIAGDDRAVVVHRPYRARLGEHVSPDRDDLLARFRPAGV